MIVQGRSVPSTAAIADWNSLLGASGTPVPLLGSVVAGFAPSGPPDPALPRFGVSLGSLALVAAFTDYPFEAIFGVPLAAADLGDLAVPLRDALLDGMVGTVALALPDPWRPLHRTADPAVAAADEVWFDVVVERLTAQPIRLAVGGSRGRLVTALAGLAPDSPVRRGLVASHHVHLAVDLVRLSIPRPLLGRLAGRLVLLPRTAVDHLHILVGERAVDIVADNGGWRCRRIGPVAAIPLDPTGQPVPADSGAPPMDDRKPAPEDAGTPALRLPVDFSIGGVDASLGEIDGWRPGSLLALDLPIPREGLPVTIRIAGTVVGSGDLVQIEDRFAVRITTLRPA